MKDFCPLLIYSLFLCWFGCFAQEEEWESIIGKRTSTENRKAHLDSFLRKKRDLMSASELADYYHDVGNKLYYRSWRTTRKSKYLDSAISFTKKALDQKYIQQPIDTSTIKKSLYNLGLFYQRHEDHFDAIKMFSHLFEMGQQDMKTITAYKDIGNSYKEIGDFHKAVASFEMIIDYYKELGSNSSLLVKAHYSIAEIYSLMAYQLNKNQIEYHLNMADSLNSVLNKKRPYDEAQIILIKGNLSYGLGDFEEAVFSYVQALDLANSFRATNLAVIHNNLGICYIELGNYEQGLYHLDRATNLFDKYSFPYENLGDLYLKNKDFKKAILNYQKAIALASNAKLEENAIQLPSTFDIEFAPTKTALLHHLVTKANGWMEYYEFENNTEYLNKALNTFELADNLIDLIRSESTEYQTQLYWREQSANLYMKAVETCFLLNDPEKAYYFMERNKALLLLEEISHEQAKDIARLPDSIAKKEFELKREIHLAENALSNAEEVDETTRLKDSIFRFKRNYDVFLDSLEGNYPDYARLKTKLEILPYVNFRSVYINENQAVVQYILNEEQGFGILHGEEGPFFFELEEASELNQNLEKLTPFFNSFQLSDQETEEFQKLSNSVLLSLLPKDGLDMIRGKTLLVVPDYLLQRIPLEALITEMDPPKYLIEDTEVTYIYSVSYLHAKKGIDQVADEEIVSVAPVTFKSQNLATLGFSLAEVEGIREIFSGEMLKEEAATKSKFLEIMPTYRILHLSTHADIDENGNHWVAFRDDKLHLNEIYANRNQAEMVVLSACNTARGDLKKGEGVMSLARAFFNSGAKSVVSTLWPAQDKASQEIMLEFYEGLDRGLTKSNALRQAKLDYINNNEHFASHPAYWASLIVIGDNSALESAFSIWDYWPLLLALILILLYLLVKKKRAVK